MQNDGDGADDDTTRPIVDRFYGRRKGRPLTPHRQKLLQTHLPELRLDMDAAPPGDLRALFAAPVADVWLEIGFGGGEHLVEQARRHTQVGFIGAEPFLNGVAKLVAEIAKHDLRTVRIIDGDVRPLLGWLPDACLGRAFILFPDPWPKRRHDDRRIVSPSLIDKLARTLRPGAKLTIASDIETYIRWASGVVALSSKYAPVPRDVLQRPQDWAVTRYEEKAVAAGRICRYLEFIRV